MATVEQREEYPAAGLVGEGSADTGERLLVGLHHGHAVMVQQVLNY
jgi:hypothetical protein